MVVLREYRSVKILKDSIRILKVTVQAGLGAGAALGEPGGTGRWGQRRRDWLCLRLGRLDPRTPVRGGS